MKNVKKIMIKKYCLLQLKYDFMGYEFKKKNELSFHHLIIPHIQSREMGIGEGYIMWNGAILNQYTSHAYLHLIEQYNRDMFDDITKQLIIMNQQGYLEFQRIRKIDETLCSFEREYSGVRNHDNKEIIKEQYTRRICKK